MLGGCEDDLNQFQMRCLLLWWLVLFIEALVLFPNIEWEGVPQLPIQRGTTSTSYPDKSSLRLPKVLAVTWSWAPRLPPSCRPSGLGLVAPLWKPLLDASVLRACACPLSTKEETRMLRVLAPAWSQSSWLTSRGPREVCLALISPPLVILPSEATPEEVLCRPPREAWPLARVSDALLMKMGRTGLLAEPRCGLQASKSADTRSQNADNSRGHYNLSLFILSISPHNTTSTPTMTHTERISSGAPMEFDMHQVENHVR